MDSMTAVRYRDTVLDDTVWLYAAAVGPAYVLMDDNKCHYRAHLIEVYMYSEGIARM